MDAITQTIKNAKILLVDDSVTQLMLLKEILESDGYTNLFETSDSRKVDYLHRTHRFDLILLDLNMPFMSGFDVIEQLKSIQTIDEGLSVIAVSGQDDEATQKRAFELGVVEFIAKPLEVQFLKSRVHTLLEATNFNV